MAPVSDPQETNTASQNQSIDNPMAKTVSNIGKSLDKIKKQGKSMDEQSNIKLHSKNINSILSDELKKCTHPLEEMVLPQKHQVVQAVREVNAY